MQYVIDDFDSLLLRYLPSVFENVGHASFVTVLQHQTDVVLSLKAVVYADDEWARVHRHLVR